MFRSFALVLCFLLATSYAFSNHHRILSRHKNLRNPVQKRDVNALTFDQKLDHFNSADTRTFKQRYFVNDQYWNKPNGPIFVYVGGEVSMSQYDVTSTQFLRYAAQNGAVLIALEHRYFGGSQPFSDLSTANLAYLSVEQALADAANFVTGFKALNQINTEVPVVAFGASYGGNIAAWLRKSYPSIFSTAVASSAPVQLTVDFSQYLVEVSKALNTITQSTECSDQIHAATLELEMLLADEKNWPQVATLFNGCGERFDQVLDTRTFVSSIMELWQSAVQYNDQDKINRYCRIMTNGGNAMNNLASVNKAELDADNNPCLNFFYSSIVDFYSAITYSDAEGAVGYRQYFYLQCTEIGFFQTTSALYPQQPFGTLVTPSLYQSECSDVFGINHAPAAAALNNQFGGKTPSYTQVLFSNGALDPWTSLSVTSSNDANQIAAVMIAGSGHSADVYVYGGANDISTAQSKISDQLRTWISQFVPSVTPTSVEKVTPTSSSNQEPSESTAEDSTTAQVSSQPRSSSSSSSFASTPSVASSKSSISSSSTVLSSTSGSSSTVPLKNSASSLDLKTTVSSSFDSKSVSVLTSFSSPKIPFSTSAPSSPAESSNSQTATTRNNGNTVVNPTRSTGNVPTTQPELGTGVGRIQTGTSFAIINSPTSLFFLIVVALSIL